MRRISQLFISICAMALFMTLAPVAFAACPYPEDVIVPDGTTATTEDMVNGQTRIKQYMAEMEAHLDCLDQEEADLEREPTEDERTLHSQRHNAAVEQMEKVAAAFNEQVRAYKKQNR
jgi:hypothetical protein